MTKVRKQYCVFKGSTWSPFTFTWPHCCSTKWECIREKMKIIFDLKKKIMFRLKQRSGEREGERKRWGKEIFRERERKRNNKSRKENNIGDWWERLGLYIEKERRRERENRPQKKVGINIKLTSEKKIEGKFRDKTGITAQYHHLYNRGFF